MADDRIPDELGIGAWSATRVTGPGGPVDRVGGRPDATGAPEADPDHQKCRKSDHPIRARRWNPEYGAFLAAGALALLVLGSSAVLPRAGLTWYASRPPAASSAPLPAGGPAEAGSPAGPAPGSSAAGLGPSPVPSTPTPSAPTPPSRSAAPPTGTGASGSPDRPAGAGPAPRHTLTRAAPPGRSDRQPVPLGPADGWALAGMLDDFCGQRYQRQAGLVRPWPGSGAEGNWACRRRYPPDIMIDMTGACGWRYGGAVLASYLDPADPFSWRCYRR